MNACSTLQALEWLYGPEVAAAMIRAMRAAEIAHDDWKSLAQQSTDDLASANAEIDQLKAANAALRIERDDLQHALRNMRVSRDYWQGQAEKPI